MQEREVFEILLMIGVGAWGVAFAVFGPPIISAWRMLHRDRAARRVSTALIIISMFSFMELVLLLARVRYPDSGPEWINQWLLYLIAIVPMQEAFLFTWAGWALRKGDTLEE